MNRLNHCLKAIYILRAFLLTSLYSPMKVSHSNSVALRTSFNLGGDPLEKKKRKKKKGGGGNPKPGSALQLLSGFKQGATLAKSRRGTFLRIATIFANTALLCSAGFGAIGTRRNAHWRLSALHTIFLYM